MANICPENLSFDESQDITEKMQLYVNFPIFCVVVVTTLVCLLIVFAWERNKSKPKFVIIIWVMISLTILCELGVKLIKHFDEDFYKKAIFYQLYYLQIVFQQVIHWMFSIEYFVVMLRFPIVMHEAA